MFDGFEFRFGVWLTLVMELIRTTGTDVNRMVMTSFVLQRVKEYLVGSSLVAKLQVKHDLLKVAVEKGITSAFLTIAQGKMLT